jgi:hypothetical protein
MNSPNDGHFNNAIKFSGLDFEPLQDDPFHVEMTLRKLTGLDMTSVRSSPIRVPRTKELVADEYDRFSLGFASAGRAIMGGAGS